MLSNPSTNFTNLYHFFEGNAAKAFTFVLKICIMRDETLYEGRIYAGTNLTYIA